MKSLILVGALFSGVLGSVVASAQGPIIPVNNVKWGAVSLRAILNDGGRIAGRQATVKIDSSSLKYTATVAFGATVAIPVGEACVSIPTDLGITHEKCGVKIEEGKTVDVQLDLGIALMTYPNSTAPDFYPMPTTKIKISNGTDSNEQGAPTALLLPVGDIDVTFAMGFLGVDSKFVQPFRDQETLTVKIVKGQSVPVEFKKSVVRKSLTIVRNPQTYPNICARPEADFSHFSTQKISFPDLQTFHQKTGVRDGATSYALPSGLKIALRPVVFTSTASLSRTFYSYDWSGTYFCMHGSCSTGLEKVSTIAFKRIEVDHVQAFQRDGSATVVPGTYQIFKDGAVMEVLNCNGARSTQFNTKTGVDVLPGTYDVVVTYTRPLDGTRQTKTYHLDLTQ